MMGVRLHPSVAGGGFFGSLLLGALLPSEFMPQTKMECHQHFLPF
jgi:hypothetical protein